uniref:RecA family profile 1 domain-containing protein n=1 Tax=Auxenochlorella protothecoides TaxID=3075 RepID=A0A1D1ZUF8_AUXPR
MARCLLTGPGLLGELQPRLNASGIHTAHDFHTRTTLDLVESLDVPYHVVQRLREQVAQLTAPPLVTASAMLRQQGDAAHPLPTRLPDLDRALHGGFPCGSVTEIVGPAGLGKTQFCLAAAADICCSPPILAGAQVLYIDTEQKFSSLRLEEIARQRSPEGRLAPGDKERLLESVLVLRPRHSHELLARLQALEASPLPLSLVLVDSVAQLARLDHGPGVKGVVARQQQLAAVAARLKALSRRRGIPVLVTNQVAGAGGGCVAAALGPLWAHAVNTRLMLHQLEGGSRYVQVAKSASAPLTAVAYRITAAGPAPAPDAPPPPLHLLTEGDVLGQVMAQGTAYTDAIGADEAW